ncbi:zinc knuckle CX2CX4HX4C containing protein, partial [Tanacetum coccineum]
AASTRNTRDEGCVSTGSIPMHNTAATPISKPLEVTDGAKKAIACPEVEKDPFTNLVQSSSQHVKNTGPILYFNVATIFSPNGSTNKNGGGQVGNTPVNEFPTSYATKVSPTSVTMDNIQKLEANVANDADYDIWLPLASVHEVNDRMTNSLYGYFIGKRLAFPVVECEGVYSVLRDSPRMIHEILIFLNKWSPSVSLLKEELSHVLVLMKFHDVPLVAYTSDGLSLMATKISNPIMLDSYINFMCLESLEQSSYARVLNEINAYNDFSDNFVMAVPNLKRNRYTKETIHVEYEWKPPHCSTCLIFSHSLVDCPKAAPKRVVNSMEKGKGQSSGVDDEGFIEVKKKKFVGNNGDFYRFWSSRYLRIFAQHLCSTRKSHVVHKDSLSSRTQKELEGTILTDFVMLRQF